MSREMPASSRAREAVAIVLVGAAVLVAAALASYDPRDPSLLVVTSRPPANWVGPVGAQGAALLYALLGLACWIVPLVFLAAALRQLRAPGERLRRSAVAGLLLVAAATGILLALVAGTIRFRGAPLPAGGLLGELAARGLVSLFGRIGTGVLAGTVLLAGMALAARSSLADSVAGGARWARRGAGRLLAAVRAGDALSAGMERLRALAARLPRLRRSAAAAEPAAPAAEPPAPAEEGSTPEPPPEPATPPVVASPATGHEGTRGKRRRKARREPEQPPLPVEIPRGGKRLPPVELLAAPPEKQQVDRRELLGIARLIERRCAEFQVEGKVTAIRPGPVVTTYEFQPSAGIRLSRITNLADDLALALEAENVRIDRIPGRPTIGIEVPNRRRELITLREIVQSEVFRRARGPLVLGLGKTQEGEVFCADLARMPHLLVAGSTGSGKSVGLNAIIASILYRTSPDEVKFILVDPKMLELGVYDGMPHLLVPVVTDMTLATNALKWAVREMERRYRVLAACSVRHLDGFNRRVEREPEEVERILGEMPLRDGEKRPSAEKIPYVVIIVDELADMLMTTGQEAEGAIARLAQKARAVGIHLVLATQRPSVDVLTGAIKANFPARIAYQVAQRVDSRTILDANGADRLLGKGDMLYRPPGSSRLLRLHGAFLSEEEVLRLVAWLKSQSEARYDDSVLEPPPDEDTEGSGPGPGARDPAYWKAVELVVRTGQASTSYLQRKMQLGYSRAARIVDQMEEDGIVGPQQGSKPRQVLVGPEFLDRMRQIDEEGEEGA